MKRKKYVEDYFEFGNYSRGIRNIAKQKNKKKSGNITALKKVSKLRLFFIACFLFVLIVCITNIVGETIEKSDITYKIEQSSFDFIDNTRFINSLVKTYGNSDIIGFLSIQNSDGNSYLTTPFAKTNDNEFYKNHNLYKELNSAGGAYIDYKINLDAGGLPKNMIIYGTDLYKKSPFNKIRLFDDEQIFQNNNIVEVKLKNTTLYYEIFAFLEMDKKLNNDKINFKNEEEFLEYTNMIEENAKHFTSVSEDDEILTLVTSYNKLNDNAYKLYAKRIDV